VPSELILTAGASGVEEVIRPKNVQADKEVVVIPAGESVTYRIKVALPFQPLWNYLTRVTYANFADQKGDHRPLVGMLVSTPARVKIPAKP
jgi:hypothetical protein